MKVTFLGLEFALENLGCEALAYSFANELSAIVQEANIDCCYTAVVFATSSDIKIPNSDQEVKCLKIQYKNVKFWKKLWMLFKQSDFIFDFTGGDSFSDLYGKKRFYMATLIKIIAIRSGAKFILGPQTYGPYSHKIVRQIAAKVIKESDYAFARDIISQKYAMELSHRNVVLTSDIAFSLPYDVSKYHKDESCINVGFNPSGLLWNGGYSHAKLSLTVDYRDYCDKVLNELSHNSMYKVHLIAHVGTSQSDRCENDYTVCKLLHARYPQTILVSVFNFPMDAKSYIANMDVFIGARMHATIAAFSSGVATIPFSYSRKFEGMYNSIDYYYVIHACKESTSDAIEKTLEYVQDYQNIAGKVAKSMQKNTLLQNNFKVELKKILEENMQKSV